MKVNQKISNIYRIRVGDFLDERSEFDSVIRLNKAEISEIWEDISTEMDINEVWRGISSGLDIVMPEDRSSGIILRSIAAVLVILLGLVPVLKNEPGEVGNPESESRAQSNHPKNIPEGVVATKQVKSNISKLAKENVLPVTRSSSEESVTEYTSTLQKLGINNLSKETFILFSNKDISKVLATSEMINSEPIGPADSISIVKAYIPKVKSFNDTKHIKAESDPEIKRLRINDISPTPATAFQSAFRRRISVGFVTSFKNTWLLNYETFNGLKSISFNSNSTEMVFFPDMGLNLNYSLNKAWLLQAEEFFYSATGQKYYEFIKGHYSVRSITLKYSTLAFSVKHKFAVYGHFPSGTSFNLHAGVYFSGLLQAGQRINSAFEDIVSQYRKYDIGLRLGGEIEFLLTGYLSMAPGLSLSVGLPNIYKGNGNIPGYLKPTRNGSEGFHIAFYYHFNK